MNNKFEKMFREIIHGWIGHTNNQVTTKELLRYFKEEFPHKLRKQWIFDDRLEEIIKEEKEKWNTNIK